MRRYRDGGERVVVVEAESGGGFGWFVLGAALGAGLALLFAPQSGARTRRDLGRRLTALKDQAEERLEELADGIEEGAERIRSRVERWSADGEEEEGDGDEEAESEPSASSRGAGTPVLSARDELERRLREARARRRRADAAEEEPVA